MTPYLHHLLRALHRYDPRLLGLVLASIVLAGLLIIWLLRRNRPSASELERRRRERLAGMGRITDGHLLDAHSLSGEESTSPTPEVLVYSYRLAGVTYNCAQDVSLLPERVRGYRIDQPLQVRYDPRNPGDSIIAAENWTGLWRFGTLPEEDRQSRIAG